MALVEGDDEPKEKRFSRGDHHSIQIRKGLQARRLAWKHVRPAIDRLAKALTSESDAVAVTAANSLLDRALGKVANAPDDARAMADAVLQVLTGVTRSPGMPAIEHMTDVTPRDVSRETSTVSNAVSTVSNSGHAANSSVQHSSSDADVDADDVPSC